MNVKPLLIETIRIQNGRVRNIEYHNRRCNSSRKALFGSKNNLDLRPVIDATQVKSPEVKCRITYDQEIKNVEYESYTFLPIKSLAYIEIGNFNYSFKFANRKALDQFYNQRGDKDDILMLKNRMITDTYYANVALLKDEKWFTPRNPLLKGTCRERLLHIGKIIESEMHIDQIESFDAITTFNSMIPFKRIVIPIQKSDQNL